MMKKVVFAVLIFCLAIGVSAATAAEKVVTLGIYQEPENLNTYIGVQTVITYVHRPFAEMLASLTRQRLARKIALGRLSETVVGETLAVLGGAGPPPGLVSAAL